MADIDDVLERLVTDPEFRAQLAADPAAALAGYELSPAERELLAAPPDDGRADLPHGVEQRTSKSALVGLLAAFAPGAETTPVPEPAAGPELEEISFTYERITWAEDDADLVAPGGGEDEALVLPAVQKVREAALTDESRGSHSKVSGLDPFTIEQSGADDIGDSAPPEPDAPPLQPPAAVPEAAGDSRDILVVKVTDHNVDAPPVQWSRAGQGSLVLDNADAPPPPPDEDFLTVDDA